MPYIAKKLGFSQMIINRVHYEVKKYLASRKALEFMWHQPWGKREKSLFNYLLLQILLSLSQHSFSVMFSVRLFLSGYRR